MDFIRHVRQLGLTPRLFTCREEFDRVVKDPVRRPHLVSIVAAGGDGTVLDLVNRHADLPIFIFPMGTENLLAKSLKIDRHGLRAAQILCTGTRKKFDLGRLNDGLFLIMVSCGIDAEIVHEVQRRRGSGHVRHWSYVLPSLKALWNFRPRTVRLVSHDSGECHAGELVVVANFNAYALGLNLVPSAQANDGRLSARVFRIRSRFELLSTLLKVAFGKSEALSNAVEISSRACRIEADDSLAVQVDGDATGTTPVEIGLDTRSVELIVPSNVSR